MKKANVEQLVWITIMWRPAVDKHTTPTATTVNYDTIVQNHFIQFSCLLAVSACFRRTTEAHRNSMEQPTGDSGKYEAANNDNEKLTCNGSLTRKYLVHRNLIWLSPDRKVPDNNCNSQTI